MVSMLFEHFVLSSISRFLGATDNQIDFKAGLSTDWCSLHFCWSKLRHTLLPMVHLCMLCFWMSRKHSIECYKWNYLRN